MVCCMGLDYFVVLIQIRFFFLLFFKNLNKKIWRDLKNKISKSI
jgi:hypothetical protein